MVLKSISSRFFSKLGINNSIQIRNLERSEESFLSQTERGVTYFLKQQSEVSNDIVNEVMLNWRFFQKNLKFDKFDSEVQEAELFLNDIIKSGSCILALPFNALSLQLLHSLSINKEINLILVENSISNFLDRLPFVKNNISRCRIHEIIKHVKSNTGLSVVYFSFPELHVLAPGTTSEIKLLNELCRLSVLDPLLSTYGIKNLITFGSSSLDISKLQLVCWDTTKEDSTAKIPLIPRFEWMVEKLSEVARIMPEYTFSWGALYQASLHCLNIEKTNQIKQIEAYFEAWRCSYEGIPEKLHSEAMKQISMLRNSI